MFKPACRFPLSMLSCVLVCLLLLTPAAPAESAGTPTSVSSAPAASLAVVAPTISAGYTFTCGIRTDGTLVCWGDNRSGQSTPPTGTFTQVSSGLSHSCAIRTDGTLACWGYNPSGATTAPDGTFIQVSAGDDTTCGVRTNGTLACWGLGRPRPQTACSRK